MKVPISWLKEYVDITLPIEELAERPVGAVYTVLVQDLEARIAEAGRGLRPAKDETYDNGVKVVPSYLLKPVSVGRDNWKEILVGSGYYTEDQITQ